MGKGIRCPPSLLGLGVTEWIGRAMTRDRVTIHGDAGKHLGGYMKGGEIEAAGSAADWIGAEMTGRLI